MKSTKSTPGGQPGNQNASRGNETRLVVACRRAEKSVWVKAAPGNLADWVRDTLNAAARKAGIDI